MAEKDIIQNMISRLGQSQLQRMARELDVHFADVDERTTEDLLLFAGKLAEFVNYYENDITSPAGNWTDFFPADPAWIKQLTELNRSADTPPHMALFLAFLELYKIPQNVINGITGRHLDFYYRDVLRSVKKSAIPDKVHLLLEMKKGAAPVTIKPEHLFSAGKDPLGVELLYAPTRETLLNSANIASLRSVFLDNRGRGTVRYAPVANSADGLGEKLAGAEAKWCGFGNGNLPPAEVGFALAAPALRMGEGERTVTVDLKLTGLTEATLTGAAFREAFDVYLTGEKSWLGPYQINKSEIVSGGLTFEFSMPSGDKGVIDYDAALHGYQYKTDAPILKLLLKEAGRGFGYHDFRGISLQSVAVSVAVANILPLTLESDQGAIDPKKAFQPFGLAPSIGSRFNIGCPEALAKKLAELTINVQWKGVPPDLSANYSSYDAGVTNSSFTAAVAFRDCGSWELNSHGVKLFNDDDASTEQIFSFKPIPFNIRPISSLINRLYALKMAGSNWTSDAAVRWIKAKPVHILAQSKPAAAEHRFVTFSLEKDFLHSTYRKKYVENVMKLSKGETTDNAGNQIRIPDEPYTPAIQRISLSYKTKPEPINISSGSIDDFASTDVQFFHLTYFGQMREHGYQRTQFGLAKEVSLLPVFENEGELIIGIHGVRAGDSASLLFQVAEGSENPDVARGKVTWSVLCDNYWQALGKSGVVLDTTNQLLASGIITFILPAQATVSNTILPEGLIWLKAAVASNVKAVCQIIDVAANAVEAGFVDNGNDADHLKSALKEGTVTRLKTSLAAVKSIRQPYASFAGRPVESDAAFHTRVSERLRHKNRCITAWDYERVILEAFPEVHKVKCIPHASSDSWLAPGNVMVIVIPDLKKRNAVDPLQPKVNADTISRITAHLLSRCGNQVNVLVKNPSYQKIMVDFKVKFHVGYEFNYYSCQLNQALVQFLSPWAFAAEREITFGGKVYKSVLLDFVEELAYVDYVTDFKMCSYLGDATNSYDLNEVGPQTPATILVSAAEHAIGEA